MRFLKRSALAVFAAVSILAATLLVAAPSSAQTQLSVQLNGNTLNLNPPAVERAGRVFVPLRGVFEQMGATVVFENGQINASGRGHNISLTIGSNQAIVDGQTQMLDVAPFIVGASTYVPLRFVSQSLGAQVNWDNNNGVVMLTMAGGPGYSGNNQRYGVGGPGYPGGNQRYGVGGPGNRQPPQMTQNIGNLRNQPQNGYQGGDNNSPIAVDFNQNVDPNSLRIIIDGIDVTAQATRSKSAIVFQPSSPMQRATHHVQVTGRNSDGQAFDQSWSFTRN